MWWVVDARCSTSLRPVVVRWISDTDTGDAAGPANTGSGGGKVMSFGSAVWPGRHARAEKKKSRPAVQSAASEE